MSSHEDGLRYLAAAASGRPDFLGNVLDAYARQTETPLDQLAERLKCNEYTFAKLRLCRAPRQEAGVFAMDIQRIAEHFSVPLHELASIIRDVSVLQAMHD